MRNKENEKTDSPKAHQKRKDEHKNKIENEVASEIKIANAEGKMEGGDNKQWHMDQGDFDENEKQSFENK